MSIVEDYARQIYDEAMDLHRELWDDGQVDDRYDSFEEFWAAHAEDLVFVYAEEGPVADLYDTLGEIIQSEVDIETV